MVALVWAALLLAAAGKTDDAVELDEFDRLCDPDSTLVI
jgi:hypothetical protein